MARGTQLQDVVSMVMRETMTTTNSAAANDFRENVKERIRSTHEELLQSFDWPFMKLKKGDAKVALAAGQRYYNFPTSLDTDNDFKLWYQHGEVWIPLQEGISPRDYSVQDSDQDERADPALKWAYYDENMFEIWPIPASVGSVWFSGRKKGDILDDDTDTLDLDDRMIVLTVAADVTESRNPQRSARLRAKADARYWQMRANTNVDLGVRVGVQDETWPPPADETGWPRMLAIYNEPP